ncbi:TIGR02391 family protein [Anaerosporobacter sp.]|uniref:TIGR02391 family protein n=1 Tax=Anaerosporobacter sp. TaxID=1872529 RepID=UPI00286EE708|nr:TIGR02391 family protein [Anaerosporobacter sp.]
MAEKIRKLTNSEIEVLARTIGECMTGSQMDSIFLECGVMDTSNESTKWKRIFYTFRDRQEIDGASNAFLNFIKKSLNPVRFVSGSSDNYDKILAEVNKPLLLMGLELTKEGKLIKTVAATTISEVERRTCNLINELQKRHIHTDVIKCCKEEYLKENYFHAVLEAAKSLAEKVREKTGLQDDGSSLFNTVFSVNNPRLAISSLQTSTDKNLQNGLKEMLNGITHMVRNVTAHELKIKWVVNEQDAIDILTTISFLHKQLDECVVVPQHII